MSVTDKAMLAKLSVTQWSARKRDKRLTAEVQDSHGMAEDSGAWNKQLATRDDLSEMVRLAGVLRETHYKWTMPWTNDGFRVLPARALFEYQAEIAVAQREFETTADSWCAMRYPAIKELARRRLNGTFDDADFPAESEIRSKFSVSTELIPIPAGADFRVDIADDERAEIAAQIDERSKAALQSSVMDAWQRLYDVCRKAADTLAQPDAIFRDSLIENVREVCGILPILNFTDDPNLEAAHTEALGSIGAYSPTDLRELKVTRANVARDADAICKQMAGLMGAACPK